MGVTDVFFLRRRREEGSGVCEQSLVSVSVCVCVCV